MDQNFAEAAGIFAGDGTLYKTNRGFVLEETPPPEEEEYYNKFVSKIFGNVFGEKLKVFDRNCGKIVMKGIRKSNSNIIEIFHNELGFPIGEKEKIVRIPNLIMNSKNEEIWIAYLRGVFDTDGCISLTKNRKKWMKPVVDLASSSAEHRQEILLLLHKLGFKCHIQGIKV
jgi:intein/homing endonuclease